MVKIREMEWKELRYISSGDKSMFVGYIRVKRSFIAGRYI